METVEDSLLQLQNLIIKARKGGEDGINISGQNVSVEELERRFVILEEQLFREQRLKEQARKLHERAKRRKQEQKEKEENKNRNISLIDESNDNLQKDTSIESDFIPIRQRSTTVEAKEIYEKNIEENIEKENFIPLQTMRESSCISDTDAHLLVNIINRSMHLKNSNNNEKDESLYSWSTPSYSFAQAYANEDRQRLFFIIDQLSYILHEERRQKETLLNNVVPVLVRHIESIEKTIAHQRFEINALKREVALQVELTRMIHSESDDDSENESYVNIKSLERGKMLELLQNCERQLHRLASYKC